jgi:hypothetical protein
VSLHHEITAVRPLTAFSQLVIAYEKVYLVLRRMIAVAELLGLPKALAASMAHRESVDAASPFPGYGDKHAAGAAVWTAISSADRLASMMFNFPPGTTSQVYPTYNPFPAGQLDPRGYLCRLADIAARVHDIDNLSASRAPESELCDKVLRIDQQLRLLATAAPRDWWNVNDSEMSVSLVLQFFHTYITLRIHVQLALKNSENNAFAFSDMVCLDACRELARRYVILRRVLPSGFFASRIIDLQALSAAIVLLKKHYHSSNTAGNGHKDAGSTLAAVDGILATMDMGSAMPGGHFARQSAQAVRSIAALLGDSNPNGKQSLTLRIPLLGRIDVRRKALSRPASARQPQTFAAPQWEAPAPHSIDGMANVVTGQASQASIPDLGMQDPALWSMEISDLPPFLMGSAQDQWLSFGNFDVGMSDFGDT